MGSKVYKLLRVAELAAEYVRLELADDPTIADDGCALHDLRAALVDLGVTGISPPNEE